MQFLDSPCTTCGSQKLTIDNELEFDLWPETQVELHAQAQRPHYLVDLVQYCLPNERRKRDPMSRLGPQQQDAELAMWIVVMQQKQLEEVLPVERWMTVHMWFKLLDDMYFFGTLTDHVQLTYEEAPENDDSCLGTTEFVTDNLVAIKVYLHRKLGSTARECMSTLLHEMCHAFMMLYACCYCRHEFRNLGVEGHGFVWQRLACLLETEIRDTFDLYIDTASLNSLGYDIAKINPMDTDEFLLQNCFAYLVMPEHADLRASLSKSIAQFKAEFWPEIPLEPPC